MTLVPLAALDRAALLALNNAHASQLSWLSAEKLDVLLSQASLALGVAPMRAAMIAFDQDSGYAGHHFAWFRSRYAGFLYVDRVVVAPEARGQGLARGLYAEVFAAARGPVACEIYSDPPNPVSDAFHAALGFIAVGEGAFEGKTVRYMLRQPPDAGLPIDT